MSALVDSSARQLSTGALPAVNRSAAIPPVRPRRQAGFTLIEWMVSIALGLIVMTALTYAFLGSTRAQREIERGSRQIENGRYAIQLLTEDLQQAGYYSELDPRDLPLPVAVPDPCAKAIATLADSLRLHVQGYNAPATMPTCTSDVRANTDALVVRRTNDCVNGSANCDDASGAPYLQASLCASVAELGSRSSSSWFVLDTNASNFTLHKKDCKTLADRRRFRTQIYFIANNNVGSDGVPTLKRAELGAGGFTIAPLVEGIENIQYEYGLDTNGDGIVDALTSDPGTYNGCADATCAVQNWANVVALKLYLLARNTEATPGYADTKTYTLGPLTVGPFNDAYKRHAYQAEVRLINPSGRSAVQ